MEEALFVFLSGIMGHSRVYPSTLPQKPSLPAVVYQRVGSTDELSSGGLSDLVEGRFQVDVYAGTYAEAKTTSRAIRNALSGYRGNMSGVRVSSARRDGSFDQYEPETRLFRVSSDYTIFFEE